MKLRFHSPFTFALILIGIMGLSALTSGCSRTSITGEIVEKSSRLARSGETSREKISLILKGHDAPASFNEVANGPSGLAVECLSTRCATARLESCHRLSCYINHRWRRPDVVVCEHDKEVACKKKSRPTGAK